MHRLTRFLTRHIRAIAIGTVAVGVIAVGVTLAMISGGGGSPAAAAPTSPTTITPPTTPSTPSTPATTPAHRHAPRVRGSITAITPSQWTITTPKGIALTVTIGPDTKFGTPRAPAGASSFTTGETVVVVGTRQGKTVQATRIAAPAVASTSPNAAATPTTTTTTGT